MNTNLQVEMVDESTVSLNIKITMSAQWFLTIAGQVYQHYMGAPLDTEIKRINKNIQ